MSASLRELTLLVQDYKDVRCSEDFDTDALDIACENLYQYFIEHPGLKETFFALLKRGPLEAGDVPSKSDKSILSQVGMCIPVISKGEWTYAVPGIFDSFYTWYKSNVKNQK